MMDENTLFITTFNKKMYDLSAKLMIESCLKHTKNIDILVCYEGFEFKSNDDRVMAYDIENDQYLVTWTKNNADVIPKMFGGVAEDDHKIFLEDKRKGQYWARYRAAGYFRKVVALNYAISKYKEKYDNMIVMDADCVLLRPLSNDMVRELLSDASMFYAWGKYRKKINRGPETGITGYSKKNNGYEFAKIICESFISQRFRDFEYWDDGYVIGRLIDLHHDKFKFYDLVGGSKKATTRVMELDSNPLKNFIHHFKNRHGVFFKHLDLFKE